MHRQTLEAYPMRRSWTRLKTMFPQERRWMGRWRAFRRWSRNSSPLEELSAEAEHLLQPENTNLWRSTHKGGRQAWMIKFLISRRLWRQSDSSRLGKSGSSYPSTESLLCWNFHPQPDSDPIEATFELNDTLYAKALVPPTDEVYLWLGANVMLSYPIDEAETLLEGKLSGAQQTLANCEEDLDFLREQITVRLPVVAPKPSAKKL